MFYAIQYAYGSMVANRGNRADRICQFARKAERDTWVAAGPAYDGPGYREALSARSGEVRQRQRDREAGYYDFDEAGEI